MVRRVYIEVVVCHDVVHVRIRVLIPDLDLDHAVVHGHVPVVIVKSTNHMVPVKMMMTISTPSYMPVESMMTICC
jgi:hypothetical protein